MKKGLSILTAVILLSGVASLPFFSLGVVSQDSEGSIIEVPGDYQTIQSAVNFAESGDTIVIGPGIYYEEVLVNKPLTIGSSTGDPADTIVEGGGKDVFSVGADNVEISGFTIKSGYYGIIQKDANNCVYENNIISHNFFGLNIEGDLQTTLTGNKIQNNHIHHSYQDAMTLEYSSENIIRGNNVVSNSHGGITLYYSDQNILEDNSLSGQSFGFHLRGSENNVIEDNYLYDNGRGMYLETGSKYNSIVNNTIIKSYSGGLYLVTLSNSNDIYNNIVMETEIKAGISLYSCEQNRIYRNDFIENYKDAFDDWDNIWYRLYPTGGNYWSNYSGEDVMSSVFQDKPGSDGFYDEPYSISGGDNIDMFPRVEPYNELVNSRPEASFTVEPDEGNTRTNFVFDASESYDEEDDLSELQFRWDWTYDGIYDTPWLTMARTTKKFPIYGTYEVRLEVKDTGGLTGYSVKEVTVHGVMTEPRVFECVPADSVVLLSWREPDSDGGDEIIGYKIYKGTSGDQIELFKTVDHRTFSYRDTQVENDVTYYYKISAFSKDREGKKTGMCGSTPEEGLPEVTPPTADFTWGPFYPKESEVICLHDLSTEGDNEIVNWTFDVNDGQYIFYGENCFNISAGVYPITLTVSDGIISNSTTKEIVIAEDISFDIGPGHADISPVYEGCMTLSMELESGIQLDIINWPKDPTNATLDEDLFQICDCQGLEVNNTDAVKWPIMIRMYYREKALNRTGVDENLLEIYYWNEEGQGWLPVENGCTVNTTDQNGYSGYVESDLDHLTIFVIAGKKDTEEEEAWLFDMGPNFYLVIFVILVTLFALVLISKRGGFHWGGKGHGHK